MEAEVLGTVASSDAAATSEGFRVGPFDDPDRYEIGEPVEAGAEGILYRGRLITPTSRLSLSVAVKALQPAYAARIDQWAARWRDQVELLRSLQIPGLVGVREGFVGPLPHRQGADTAGRNLYLVMNWVEGEALDHWVLRHRGVDVSNALKLLLPVAVAVDTMHGGQLTGSVPVVHRDIKPANILIGKGGSVLVDFGLTKGLSIGRPVGRAGTPGYIAPEVVAGGGYTPAADRYAFGATVFFLLTGRHPSTATTLGELRQYLETAPIGGGVSPELVDRVVAMLDPDPERRPAALANWIAQLRQSSLDDEVLTVRLAPPAPARVRRSRSDSSAATAGSALSGGVGVSRTGGATGIGSTNSSFTSPPRTFGTGTGGGAGTARGTTGTIGTGFGTGFGTDTGTGDGSSFTSGTATSERSASAGWEVGADGYRRGGAHRANHRAPQHARPPRAVSRRYALAVMLAVALTVVASDAGALARTAKKAVGPATLSVVGAPVTGHPVVEGGGSVNAVSGLPDFGPEVANQNAKTATSDTTMPGVACIKSFSPACGPLVWTPPVVNRALTISITVSPSNPVPGQPVTFTIVLDDPDDTNLSVNGVYFGDPSSASGQASAPANATGPSCPVPHGSWPAPAPNGHGHLRTQKVNTYLNPGTYQVHFTASSGKNTCVPDPYASTAVSGVQTVVVSQPSTSPSTTIPPTTVPSPTTTLPPATTTTSTTAAPASSPNSGI
jgi:serine/threonine protein kinase